MKNPTIAQKNPYHRKVGPGKYTWCACGNSNDQPYCDGSHYGTGFTPIVVEITEHKSVAWCGCKHSKNKPYCDGSHKNFPS